MKHKATIGTIIEGTMHPEDVIPAMAAEARAILTANPCAVDEASILARADTLRELAEIETRAGADEEHATEDWTYLEDILNEHAPPYCYFGSHPNDGADYGFWPCEEFLDRPEDFDVQRINGNGPARPVSAFIYARMVARGDADRVQGPGEYLAVNDHGNCTFGHVDARGKWHEAWAIV